MDELVTHQPIAARHSGIHGQQQCQLVLVDLLYAQNPGELLENPGLVVSGEVHTLSAYSWHQRRTIASLGETQKSRASLPVTRLSAIPSS